MQKRMVLFICSVLILGSMAAAGCQTAAKKPMAPDQKPNTTDTNDAELSASERRVMASRLSNMAQEVDGVKSATVVVSSIGMTGMNTGTNTGTNTGMNNRTNNRNTTNTLDNNMNGQATNNANPNTVTNRTNTGTNASGLVVMIGITLDQNKNDANMANQVKRNVVNKIKASDKRISQVLVTTDPGMVERLNDVAAGIIQGRPIQGYQDDLSDLTRSMRQQQPAF